MESSKIGVEFNSWSSLLLQSPVACIHLAAHRERHGGDLSVVEGADRKKKSEKDEAPAKHRQIPSV